QERGAVAEGLVRGHAPRLAPRGARAADEGGAPLGDRRDQGSDLLGGHAAVAVDEHEHGGVGAGGDAGEAGVAIAATGLVDHPGAGGGGDRRGAVAAAVVDDEDVGGETGGDAAHHLGDGPGLVEGGDDHGAAGGLVGAGHRAILDAADLAGMTRGGAPSVRGGAPPRGDYG